MSEPTKHEAAVAQMLLENKHWVDEIDAQENPTNEQIELNTLAGIASKKREQEEAEWDEKMHKIEQNHDFMNERETEGEEE